MIIAHIASEVFPFSKTGGLSDVAGALPASLANIGHEVIVISPLYKSTAENFKPKKHAIEFTVDINGTDTRADIYYIDMKQGVKAYFIKNDEMFFRDGLYLDKSGIDYKDNSKRFIFFSRSSLELIKRLGYHPDIIHSHDWQSGLVPAYMKTLYRDMLGGAVSIFTIHNIGYQGLFWYFDMPLLGIDNKYFTSEYLEYYGNISFLKAGIVFSDAVTTVSPTYGKEILTSKYGYGMEGILKTRKNDLFGILNGVDYEQWNPKNDRYVPNKYDFNNIEFKADNKNFLNRLFNLDAADAPIIGMITRLDRQKGIELILEAIGGIISMGIKFVLLGSGNKIYEDKLRELANKYKGRCGIKIGFDNAIAHLIEAGCDMYLMPSLYEPCGLNQMYSLKYGTIPIVRATGGLNDTIEEYDPLKETGNGFKFGSNSSENMLTEIKKAVAVYNDRTRWQRLIKQCMLYDFSWDKSAGYYELLYKTYLNISYLHGNRNSIT
ncbi:MAG: glycogen synthase GlgA [Deltaproteobacteria bacterium]|nr:glycogen synthase GlgA [Deltaproteobacteria bacterium]MCL5791822.1 glycogen synthase GlgA [Deltaproteobacteria bacterium]